MPNANAIANVFKLIEENDIKFALLRFTDIKGKEHGVSIPVSLVDEDMFEDGKMFDGSSVEGWKTINRRAIEHFAIFKQRHGQGA